jgi:hypothetical protein
MLDSVRISVNAIFNTVANIRYFEIAISNKNRIPCYIKNRVSRWVGRASTQKVSCRPLIAESQVCALVSPCGICDWQSNTVTGFSPSFLVCACKYHSTLTLHSHVLPGGWTIWPLVAAVQRHRLTPLIWITTSRRFNIYRKYLLGSY